MDSTSPWWSPRATSTKPSPKWGKISRTCWMRRSSSEVFVLFAVVEVEVALDVWPVRGLSCDLGTAMEEGSALADSSMLIMYSRCWALSRASSSSALLLLLLLLLPMASIESCRFRRKGSSRFCQACKSRRQSVDSSSMARMASRRDSSVCSVSARTRPSRTKRDRHERISVLVDSTFVLLLLCCFSKRMNRS